ncbi:MAG: type VI secretion system protein [Pseudomonadota bacterium]|nr:type VI secretion system protein [Pseudomonadota bacterium]
MTQVAATGSSAPNGQAAAAQDESAQGATTQGAGAQSAPASSAPASSPAAADPAASSPAAPGPADPGTIDFSAINLGSIDLANIDVLKTSLAACAVLIGLVIAGLVVRRLRRPAIITMADADGTCGICARVQARLQRWLVALDYLSTRREWRYAQPWLLVLGEQGAGKSSLIASVSATWRHAPPEHADQLHAEGMRWSYFRHGVLIDGDGALAAAAEGEADGRLWAQGLKTLSDLRPERPLDGLVLCVSARTLRNARQSQRIALAENVNRQLSQLQANIEFMLPAYVVVTQCDDIPGFASFWQNQAADRLSEMVGYSAIAQDQSRPPSEWADTAFDRACARMREVQTDVAALRDTIDDVDGFFLFPAQFSGLRAPLAQWLETVFRTTAWQSGYLFRGLYFTGAINAGGSSVEGVRGDVDFVDDLVSQKALREPALAKPTRQGIWSRNRLIHQLQIAAVAAAAGLFVALGVAGLNVSKQVDLVVAAIHSLDKIAPRVPAIESGECLAREDVYPLLTQVSRIDTRSRYVVIPLSWVDGRLTSGSASAIGRSTVQNVLLPTVSCLLEERSRELLASARMPADASVSVLSRERDGFRQLVVDARALEDNLARFQTLSHQNDDLEERELIAMLDQLASYVFGERLPEDVWRKHGVLDDAFREIDEVRAPVMPNGLHQRMATAMEASSARLRAALGREVSAGNDLLTVLKQGQPPILDNTRRMGLWLSWVQGSWLGSSPVRNPCQDIVNANKADVEALIAHYGNLPGLAGMLQRFDARRCHQPEMQALATMTIAPYGPMFISGKGGLMLAPELQDELPGLPALVELPYMQLTSARPFACVGAGADWRADEIAEAAGYLRQYEAFAKSRNLPPLIYGGRPLYDSLARESLAHALDDALRRAQRVPDDSQATVEAANRTDAQLTRVGGELAQVMEGLKAVLNAYAGYGFSDGGTEVRQCARGFAADNLGGVDALADGSRLYAPPVAIGNDAMFTLGALPVTRDFLARQVARAQVLAGYAEPFLSLLSDTPGVDDAWRDTPQTAAFWRNTRDEIDRYIKGKEPAGQIANLDAYFIAQLTGMTYANCASLLAAYTSPEYGNDLFSDRRRKLERQVQLRCSDQRQAQAQSVYDVLATRFNRDLAGRYPFGEITSRDAGLQAVRMFFLDYAKERERILTALNAMDGNRWRAARAFVAELDAVATLFAGNVGAPGQTDAMGLRADFPAEPSRSVGGDQLVTWRLTAGDAESAFPNGLKPLQWWPGDPLALQLRWAARSQWRPLADPAQPGLRADDATATFSAGGPWALLRFIDTYRMPTTRSKAPGEMLLGLHVPVQTMTAGEDGKPVRSQARVFMTLALTAVDPKTQTETALVLPGTFPRSAPVE